MGPIIAFGGTAQNNPSHRGSLAGHDTWGEVNGSVWAKCLHGHFYTWPTDLREFYFLLILLKYTLHFQHMDPFTLMGPSIPANSNLLLPLVSLHIKPPWFLQQDVSLPLALTLQMSNVLGLGQGFAFSAWYLLLGIRW